LSIRRSPPAFWDFLAPHSSLGWGAFGILEFGGFFLAIMLTSNLWILHRYGAAQRWKGVIITASAVGALYGVGTTFLFGWLVLWGDAIGVWFDKALALADQAGCSQETVTVEHTNVLAAYNTLVPSIFWMMVLLVVFCQVLIVGHQFLGWKRKRSNPSST
jgi:hypothetical protein